MIIKVVAEIHEHFKSVQTMFKTTKNGIKLP